MKKKKYVDIISGILLIALGSIYFYSATTLPEALTTEPLGPAGFPQFLAVVLIALSLWILVKAILDKSERGEFRDKIHPQGHPVPAPCDRHDGAVCRGNPVA